jgi:ornithine cyclodeaminase/alanine dehydrogenase-like protein (mu-crystallin family)
MLLVEVKDLQKLISLIGLKKFMKGLIEKMEFTFSHWKDFEIRPRDTFYFEEGVVETMPIANEKFYTVKLVNGHPSNPSRGLLTVTGIGVLVDVKTGYPLIITESTLLTALRTAATTALATKYLAKESAGKVGIIGTGAQSEFQILGISCVRRIKELYCFDIDRSAMEKFKRNIKSLFNRGTILCKNCEEVVRNSEIIVTATAPKGKIEVVKKDWLRAGSHINAIGGDAPGKTELDKEILKEAKIVVEFFEQTKKEGEIQNLKKKKIYGELWEIVTGKKKGRENEKEITLFDSVGFALEDWAAYTYLYNFAKRYKIGKEVNLIPKLKNCKDLISLLI